MESGYQFENNGTQLVCILFYSLGKRNVGLYQQIATDIYITARDISKEKDGTYSWAWGHYFTDQKESLDDYYERISEMRKYTD